ncbi:maleylpyruvate isomerase family mycothiol-dependent enzyme [Phytoactinopolyspora mesophila]|uniref:maleylpyruvate isomerase family mycothiol-dependent enzyme n=1 Tax=Phytoactinopolyspora mesophila TaxID=2650750 RepID=UPI0013920E97
MTPDVEVVLEECASAGGVLRDVLAAVDDEFVNAPSALPGWSRGHVLAHIANVGDAAARQVEYAARAELVEFYDGGREGRNAAIEAGAVLPASEHQERLARVFDRLEQTWPPPGSALWDQRVSYREGTVFGVALAWWRETRIHLVDLDAGIGADTWSETFCRHLFEFLAPRLPSGTTVELRPNGHEPWRAPDAPSTPPYVSVHGDIHDIAMWLAGRVPACMPVAFVDGQRRVLPALDPWPSAR